MSSAKGLKIIIIFALLIAKVSGEILEIYPNPRDENQEYVKIRCNETCVFTDFESEFKFEKGVHYIARNSSAFKERFGFYPDAEGILLSNSGEVVELVDGSATEVFNWADVYLDEGVIYFKKDGRWDFRYEDWSSFKHVSDNVSGEIIISPCEFVLNGSGIVYSYTVFDFDSFEGNFTFAVDGDPAGGVPLNVKVLDDRFDVHYLKAKSYKSFHAKFAVVGNKSVITTENWKWDKRGVIVVVNSEKFSNLLKRVFENDLKYSGDAPKSFGKFVKYGKGKGKRLKFEGYAELYVLPDENPIFDFVKSAKRRLFIVAPSIDFSGFAAPLLDSILEAKRNGADVKVLVSYGSVEYLKKYGVDVGKLESPKIHGKFIVADDSVLITSANLNEYGLKLNREVAVVIRNEDVADFFSEVFMEDFNGGFNVYHYLSLTISSVGFFLAVVLVLRRLQ